MKNYHYNFSMDNYIKIKEIFTINNCNLTTSFDEFERKRETVHKRFYHFVRVDFIGICGHLSSAVVTNFTTRKTGIRCKDCVKNNTRNTLLHSGNKANIIEYDGYKLVKEYLSPHYEVNRTKEGCRADIAIRKLGEHEDKWIPIQLKVTTKMTHNMYGFRKLNKEYKDMLICGVCTSENKIWIIPFNLLTVKTNLNISTTSKYNKYLVLDNLLLDEHIHKYNAHYTELALHECMTPISILQQREQAYVKKREDNISFLRYDYPGVQNTSVDFSVNGKRVQEKVLGFNKYKSTICTSLHSNNGRGDDKKRKFRSYRLGENDYYWFHSCMDDRFWIVPESVLYDRKLISDEEETKCRKVVFIPYNESNDYRSSEWIRQYEYNYNQIDKDKIIKLFE